MPEGDRDSGGYAATQRTRRSKSTQMKYTIMASGTAALVLSIALRPGTHTKEPGQNKLATRSPLHRAPWMARMPGLVCNNSGFASGVARQSATIVPDNRLPLPPSLAVEYSRVFSILAPCYRGATTTSFWQLYFDQGP
jgi:hypothetical protein